jgi:hypothetical protein
MADLEKPPPSSGLGRLLRRLNDWLTAVNRFEALLVLLVVFVLLGLGAIGMLSRW